jgi:N-methylhydantoinase A
MPNHASNYALAVDIGGTFTDVVLRSVSGQTWVDKTLTTPESLDIGFFRAVDSALAKAGIEAAAVTDVVVHATTVVTNAVIERKGPLTALLVTEGFRDILTIKDEHRYEMFDPQIEFPEQLVTREMTLGCRSACWRAARCLPRSIPREQPRSSMI